MRVSTIFVLISKLLCNSFAFQNIQRNSFQSFCLNQVSEEYKDLEKCLFREYSSFFNPMEKSFYDNNVKFIDPLTSLTGIESYMNNVNMLSGRTSLGKVMFDDANIQLHNIVQLGPGKMQTRWTLKVTVKAIPWKPRAKFTGVSIYTLNNQGKVIQQDDYWDSINLKNGEYTQVSKFEGISDFLSQLQQDSGAEMVAPELPYELLRRAQRYEVRRYPATVIAETTYEQRPQGYDRLGSYVQGSNIDSSRLPYFAPTLMRVSGAAGTTERIKYMSWPLAFELPKAPLPALSTYPAATIPSVKTRIAPAVVVAVTRFDVAATEPVARGYTDQLKRDVIADKMKPSKDVDNGVVIVGQFDALFSLNKRRNEVWIELDEHPWR